MAEFPATRWTIIRAARAGDEEALRVFANRYRPPIVRYLRSTGFGEEAEDLAQEVFLRLFGGNVLLDADPARGRFRSLLRAVTRNVVGNHLRDRERLKRGGGRQVESLGNIDPVGSDGRDEGFDREWLAHLLELALGRLKAEHPPYHAAIKGFLLQRERQADLALALGCSAKDVKNRVYRGRGKLVGYLQEEVAKYSLSREEHAEELQLLARLLPPA